VTDQDPEAVQELSDWLIETSLHTSDYEPMFTEFCERLAGMGIPIARVSLAMTTIHPLMEAVTLLWSRGQGVEGLQHHAHRSNEAEDWQVSPLKALVDSGENEVRHHLSTPGQWSRFPLLQKLADGGLTDYLAFLIRFSDAPDLLMRQDGMMMSWSTDQPDGFSSEQIVTLKRLIPRFALVAKLANRERRARNVAYAYLGENAGERVMNGQIKLGDGENIRAVIWFSDLRNSTPLAEQLSREDFLALLNDYFDALAGAVMENGGEVLRFIGDAALAIFPIGEDGFSDTEARERALRAASDAASRAAVCNANRTTSGQTPFRYGIGLHVGDIMYGNIGVPSRVEFSVIGAAANEAARLEGLTKELGETVLVSKAFADNMDVPWCPLGEHAIRGSERRMEVFAPPSGTAQ